MKRIQYPKAFLLIWNAFDEKYGKKGPRHKAYLQYIKLKINDLDVKMIVQRIELQKDERNICKRSGIWIENFVHIHRYLRDRRWEDEASERVIGQTLSGSDQRTAEALERYRSRHLGDGVVETQSGEGNVRTHRQHDLRVLEGKP